MTYDEFLGKVVDKRTFTTTDLPLDLHDSFRDVTVTPIEGTRDSLILDNVLSLEECAHINAKADELGFTFWNEGDTSDRKYRSAFTVEVEHQPLADLLFTRIAPHLQRTVAFPKDDERWSRELGAHEWKATGVNPHLMFGKYSSGGHFGPHTDGSTVVDVNNRTIFTALVYLEDTLLKGRTHLLRECQKDAAPLFDESTGQFHCQPDNVVASVQPRAGRVLIFYHDDMHEAEAVGDGCSKRIIRTDIFYTRQPAILTSASDQNAYSLWQEGQLLAEKGEHDAATRCFRQAFKQSNALCELLGM
ncbi:MAG: hypothetical protein KVP17_002137 [Porospora cf. gigantea B]|uniref:uncharacterized protein n=1 Tax=Porospora cf. gigantea B TaxID=2853592 RepID=UPI003571B909|nr:MAG: hypothetical protein KVP17_002137 [Porospora cf. gigantea B]